MRTILLLIRKDLLRFKADTPAIVLTFVVPIVLILIFGNIFGGGSSSRGKINVIFVNESLSKIAKTIEAKLDSSDNIRPVKYYVDDKTTEKVYYTEAKAKSAIEAGVFRAALVFPTDFISDTSSSLNIKFYYDPSNEIEISLIQGSVQKLVMSEVPTLLPYLFRKQINKQIGLAEAENFQNKLSGLIGKFFNVDADSINLLTASEDAVLNTSVNEADNPINNLIKFDSVQLVGKEVANPGVTRIVGGWAIMFLLFSLTGAAMSLFEEKTEGTLKRLLCMPVQRSQILWSKYSWSMLLGVVQLSVMFIFAWLVFDVDIFSNLLNLIIVIIASAAAAVSFGMIITSFAKSLNQANGISTLLILVISALGGSWFPVSLLPDWMQVISKGTLTYWSVEAFLQVLWRGASFSTIAPHVMVLLSTAFIANFYSLLRFRKGKVF